nr:putative ribonuclease H-like domain-containing protein [Tanacetum cinerariifolium]
MDSQSAPVVSAAKLPILNPNEFDLWKMRIEQYFLMTDYSPWEVIINGDFVISRAAVDGVAQPVTVLTAEQKLARKNELKARGYRSLLANLKFMGNKANLEEHGLDDLFNSFKIYETKVRHSSYPSNPTKNLAFVSSSNTDSTTDSVSAATIVSAVCVKFSVSSHLNIDSLKEELANFALMAISSSSSSYDNEKNIIVLKNEVEARDNFILTLKQKLKQAETERGYLSSEDDSESVSLTCPSDRLSSSGGYHAVPPPITGNFMPPKPDLVFNTAPLTIESDHLAFNVQVSPAKPAQAMSHTTVSMAPIIEEWVSDSEDESEPNNPQSVSIQPIEVPILAATPKPTIQTSSSGKRKNKKTCFVCRSVDHLIKDCNFHVKPQTKSTPKNSVHKGCNKQYASFTKKYPQKPKVPAAVLYKSKPVYVTTVRQVSVAVPKIMKSRLRPAHPLNRKSNPSIKSAVKGKKGKWVWRPKCPILDHDSRTTGASLTLKLFDYNDALGRSKSATIDESNLWHRRLGHINFKTINKLVKGNLVRGLPTKVFENQNTCVACKKGKQHRASCKTKLVSSVNQPLFRLHMDLFGPTFVKSLNKKNYYLVITDDYSRFTWVFFLATKDETSPTLKNFITGLENQLSLKVKVIRSDNGTEFKNSDLNQFCGIKGIKREFSVPTTPQPNGIAERKNKTLIEAARTMLADSLLPILFWAEAVNTACYVQNKVLVTKPHNKTPYELLHGRTPSIGFMRPFGCPVTILNTLDTLGKFEGKVDEGFLVGYSVNSSGPTWLFDIDSLTKTINYQPVTAGNHTNLSAGFQDTFDADKVGKGANLQYVLFSVSSTCSSNPQNKEGDTVFDKKEHDAKKPESAINLSLSRSALSREKDDMTKKKDKGKSPVECFSEYRDLNAVFEDFSEDSSNDVSAAINAAGHNYSNSTNPISAAGHSNSNSSPTHGQSSLRDTYQPPDMVEKEDIIYSDHENVGTEADFNNLETSIT